MVVTKKTLILHFQDNPGENREFTYEEGDGDIYINSAILVSPNDDHHYADYIQTIDTIDNPEWKYVILDNNERILYGEHSDDGSIYSPDLSGYIISNGDSSIYASVLINDIIKNKKSIKKIKPINGYYVIYFSSKSGSVLSTKIEGSADEPTRYEYSPIDSEDSSLYKEMTYKRLDMMIDDDTSYSILRVNPKLTGNVKVVVDSESNMYLDTFKVSLGLSQNKYRHIPINPSEYYGRTLMSKMRSIPTDDFYKIEDSCYDLFATANDFDEQYYDKYNYGVRTNTDKMYSENYSLLAPLCIRKVLPDFFLIFKINDYESLFNGNNIKIANRTEFIDCNKCELIKSFDFRQGTKLGSYIRRILENNKDFVGDVYTGSDYDHFNIFNGISLEHGVVSNIYEETTQERSINNQVSMNDWYTLGFQRNHIVSKDIINFEFMFDDTSERLFSLPTYFGVYVRLNGEDETFTCIDIDSGKAIFDSSIHGLNFDPSFYPTVIYGLSTDKEFKRLKENISKSEEAKSHKLEAYKSIVTVDTYDISSHNNGLWVYASNKLNDVLDPGEHYRILDLTNNTIYEVIVSNFFDDDELSDISYTQYDINGKEFQIVRISILNTEYRSNIDEKDKQETIKKQLSLITKAFNKLSNNISAYDDGKSSFSLLYKKNSTDPQTVMFEKISSICGFNKENDDIIKNNEYIDKSSYIFGCDSIEKMIIDPKSNSFDDTDIKVYYPIGFESLGTRVAYCVNFMDIVYNENGETMVLINDDIQKNISPYKTVLYTTKFNENKLYRKNIEINYISIEGNFIVTKHTNPMYSIVGFGHQESYIIKFEFNPLIKTNGKLQFYQNFPMNSGICSIFPLKDYYLDVLDKDSVFFLNNENNPEEGTKVGGDLGEYTKTETNVYNKQIIQKSEEFIADYCDKFKTYNVNTSGFGYMDLDNIEDLAVFLENMQINGHNKFDISLISPYCCKWRILGTDETGNRMRVMYNFTENKYKVYTSDDRDCEDGYLINSGDIINPGNSFKTSPFIDISENKDIIINSNVPYGYKVETIAYYTDINTIPIALRYARNAIDTDLVKISNYIRITYLTYRNFKTTVIISKSYSKNPFLVDSSSYWIPSDDNTHIGFVSCNLGEDDNNMKYTKYIYNYYDEDETGGFNSYIYNSEENGSIEDLLYRNENHLNKFSKIYKYGDNSIEFVSCGIKARIKSTDKSKINLSKYVGYSVILLSMSGNNANQPGTYELFIDETKEQAALIIYNGLSSDNNKIQRPETITSGIHRIKHSIKLSDCVYDGGGLKIKDDGYLTKIEGIDKVVDEKSDIFLISKPTTNGEKAESTSPNQIVIYGKVKDIHFDEDINERYIRLDGSSNLFLAKDDKIETINSNQIIKTLDIGNNNVDAYINLSEIDSSTCINIATNSLSLSQLKKLTSYYTITIKNENETKKYNNVASIISIDLVDPFKIERENTKYEVITSGYTHPSYSVPVMKDVFKFEYAAPVEISDSFLTWFNGCNIILNDVDYINQTWMKKVIDIDNIMKSSDKDASTMIIRTDKSYEIIMVPDDGKDWFIPPKIYRDIYKEKIDNGLSDFGFYIKDVRANTYDLIDVCDVNDMVIKPNNLYKKWIADEYHSLEFPNDFIDMKLEKNEGKYSGRIIINNDDVDYDKAVKGIYRFDTKTLSGFVDDSSIIDTLQFDSSLYGKNDSSTIYEFCFDGTEKIEGRTKLYLRTFDVSVGDISVGDLKSLYFVQSPEDSSSDAIKFDQNDNPVYEENGLSRLIYFNVSNMETTKKCQEASISLYSEDVDSFLHNTSSGILQNTTNVDDLVTHINFKNAIDKSSTKEIKNINQSNSVTLLRNHDPLIGYWYTNMCRLFSKYDTYISYYGAFSGFEKNNYIASRGINLKTKDSNGNIIHGIDLTTWVDTVESPSDKKIVLNITSSIINFINSDKSNGYSDSWSKNQKYINSKDVSYSGYKSKYIENTILKLIDINNNTKFILYVDKSSDKLEFKYEKPSDTSSYEEMKNLENTIVFSENRYYMNIENLEPHRYYAEMIIMF